VGLDSVGLGLAISTLASALNGAVGVFLVRAGRRHRSVTLAADGKHLLTDVWTSAGVIVGVLLVGLTGWQRLDPVVAALPSTRVRSASVSGASGPSTRAAAVKASESASPLGSGHGRGR